jgi:hypothetical protein
LRPLPRWERLGLRPSRFPSEPDRSRPTGCSRVGGPSIGSNVGTPVSISGAVPGCGPCGGGAVSTARPVRAAAEAACDQGGRSCPAGAGGADGGPDDPADQPAGGSSDGAGCPCSGGAGGAAGACPRCHENRMRDSGVVASFGGSVIVVLSSVAFPS